MDFFYFGLSFYHLKTVIVRSPKLVAVHNLEEYSQCADMVKTIKDDLRQLENSEMGGKGKGKWKGKVGKFLEVSLTNSCVVYMYLHQQHAAFSATQLSQLLECRVFKGTSFTRPRLPTWWWRAATWAECSGGGGPLWAECGGGGGCMYIYVVVADCWGGDSDIMSSLSSESLMVEWLAVVEVE